MTQVTLNIEDQSSWKLIRDMMKHLPGISIARSTRKRKTGLDKALEEIRRGEVDHHETVDDFFKAMGI